MIVKKIVIRSVRELLSDFVRCEAGSENIVSDISKIDTYKLGMEGTEHTEVGFETFVSLRKFLSGGRAQILDCLIADPSDTIEWLSRKVDMSYQDIERNLKLLIQSGFITKGSKNK